MQLPYLGSLNIAESDGFWRLWIYRAESFDKVRDVEFIIIDHWVYAMTRILPNQLRYF